MLRFLLIATFVATAQCFKYPDNGSWEADPQYPLCGGDMQSGINIKSDMAMEVFMKPLWFSFLYYEKIPGKIVNDGKTMKFSSSLGNNAQKQTYFTGGPAMDKKFIFAQMHCHWGADEMSMGSEHQFDDEGFPMECHMVHYNSDYADLNEAVDKSDGLSVLGFVFRLNPKAKMVPHELMVYVNASYDVPNKDDETNVMMRLSEFLQYVHDTDRYATYHGSLTTPPCYESVKWIVFRNTIQTPMIPSQLYTELLFDDSTPMINNFRDIQVTGDRAVYKTYSGTNGAPMATPPPPMPMTTAPPN